MKRIYFLLFVLIATISFHCQKEISFNTSDLNAGSLPSKNTIQGNILDENGQPASGVVIRVGNKATSTNAKGYFRIANAALDQKASVITAEKNGYFKAYRTFAATSGVNQVVIKLIPKNFVGSVSSSGGEVTLSNGTKISLPANGVKMASGGSYSGTINVYAAYIDPTKTDIAYAIPGSLMADDKNNNRVVLTSYGMLAVELQSSTGEKLQIAQGNTATLTMPIPNSIQATAPSSISLWYVDEQTGIWKEEGTATKTGNNYVGQVSHFSFWNCDVSSTAIQLSMTLHTPEGGPLVHALVKLTRPSGSSSYGWTDSLGQVSGPVPSNEALLMEVLAYPCNTVIYSQNIGPFTQSTNLGIITVQATSSSLVTIQGKLLNCNGAPVTDGNAIIYYDNVVRYAATNSNGNFSIQFIVCSSNPSCDIIGVDNAAQQQSSLTSVNIVTPVTNAGNISACGTSSSEYINYTLDGTSYSITQSANDTVSSYSFSSQGSYPQITDMFGAHFPDHIFFIYGHNGTAGSFPLADLGVNPYDSMATIIQPFNINITTYPQNVGQFYVGNFTGQFTHFSTGAVIHNISCSFRVRK